MNTEELNALKERAHKTAVEHGFCEEGKSDAYYLGLVMSEMGEAINADRKGWHARPDFFTEDITDGYPFRDAFMRYIMDSLEDKIANIVIRLLDFAGMKGYKLQNAKEESETSSSVIIEMFAENGLPGTLFHLNGVLSDALDENITDAAVSMIIYVISDCFKKMTGSDKDLWWFVERKIGYNEVRPKLNGKKY